MQSNRAEYYKNYYRQHRDRYRAIKAHRQKNDIDYRLRSVLRTIVARCESPRHVSYRWYGGKGIRNFLTLDDLKALWLRDGADKMVRPSIDRASSDDDYEFSKCCFRELRDNQERAWVDKEARAAAIRDGLKARSVRTHRHPVALYRSKVHQ